MEGLTSIFVAGGSDIPTSVNAMKAGAVELFTRPYQDQDLLNAIQHPVQRSRNWRKQREDNPVLEQRYASLTPRERQVFALVVHGLLSKQIAAQLGCD